MITIQNDIVRVSFRESGALSSLFCISGGRELLLPHIQDAPFAVWTDFTGGYESRPVEPSAICARSLTPASAVLEGCETENDRITLRYGGSGLKVQLQAVLSGPEITLTLTLHNPGPDPIPLLPVFPSLPGVDMEESAGAKMLIMNQAGYVGPCWLRRGGFYGNSWEHSAQFGCLFDDSACLGFYIRDDAFRCKDISYQKPALEIRWAPGMTLSPGESVTLPQVVLMVYEGSWQKTARAYGDWFRAAVRPDPTPKWVQENTSYVGAWSIQRGGGMDIPGKMGDRMDSFDELPENYRQNAADVREYAFFCELSSTPRPSVKSPCGSGRYAHTDGWNQVRSDLGGAAAMKRGARALQAMGRHMTLYVEGLITPPESDLYVHRPEAKDWLFMDQNGVADGNYSDQQWNHMCPGSGWQDHVPAMCRRLMEETGCDGIRLDCLGLHFKPCWNPAHHHDSPYDYNRWMQDLMAKSAAAVKSVHPDALLSTEYPVDYFSVHFNHALFQPFDDLVWHSLREPSPLRVALPHYRLDSWYGGAVAQAMQLLPMSVSVSPGWMEVRHMVSELFLHGEVLPDPRLSRTDAVCRHLGDGSGELLLFTRPDFPENPSWELTQYDTAGELPLKEDGAETLIRLPLDYDPAQIIALDVMHGGVEQIPFARQDDCIVLKTGSSFCALVIRRQPGDAFVQICADTSRPGELKLTFDSPMVATPLPASLTIAELSGCRDLPVTLPGSITLPLKQEELPVLCKAYLRGQGIVSGLKIIQIPD